MLKKWISIMVLTLALVFVGSQNNQAEAREVYVGTYSDGSDVYLLTETISMLDGEHTPYFYCKVRAGRDYLNYDFYESSGKWYYKNSEGYRGQVYNGQSPVAANIFDYIRKKYNYYYGN